MFSGETDLRKICEIPVPYEMFRRMEYFIPKYFHVEINQLAMKKLRQGPFVELSLNCSLCSYY